MMRESSSDLSICNAFSFRLWLALPSAQLVAATVCFAQSTFITVQPLDRAVHPGTEVIFGVATSPGSYDYQWRHAGNAIEGANQQTLRVKADLETVGEYAVTVSSGESSETSQGAMLSLLEDFDVALDSEFSVWSTIVTSSGEGHDQVIGQENYWLSQNSDTFDGVDALSIVSRPNQLDATVLETSIDGPFELRFQWKADRPDLVFMRLEVRAENADDQVTAVEMPVDAFEWEEASIRSLEQGSHRLSWIFAAVFQPIPIEVSLDQVQVNLLDPFEVWTIQQFSEDIREQLGPELAATDSDKDGLPNQLEWALLSDPLTPNQALRIHKLVDNGQQYLALSFSKNPSLGPYSFGLETSADLVVWTPAIPIELPPDAVGVQEGKTVWRDPSHLTADLPRFIRLAIGTP